MQRSEAVRARIMSMSKALAQCSQQASQYGKCVTKSVKKHQCTVEFQALNECMKIAARKGAK